MILTIDRVLQLLSEGKTIDKISDLASCEESDVVAIIDDARKLLLKHEKISSRKKIIIRKKPDSAPLPSQSYEDEKMVRELLSGAELSVIPINASLIFYVGAESSGSPGNSGIGIVILDSSDRQIGKVSDFIGKRTKLTAVYMAVIRAIQMAEYFQVKDVKIRTDSDLLIKHINGSVQISNKNILRYYENLMSLLLKNKEVKIEYIPRHQNDKAKFFAIQGSEKGK